MIDKQEQAVYYWSRYILTKGKFESLQERSSRTKQALNDYFSSMEDSFVSNNSKEFTTFLEERLGPIEFTCKIAMKTKPETHLYLNGREQLL